MDEIEKIKRTTNMMITAHSVLRDRYLRLSAIFENGLLIASAFLNAFVFIDDQFINETIGISSNNQKLFIGFLSIVVFAISIVLLQVKWKVKASKHANAASQLFVLKQECNSIIALEDKTNKNLIVNEFIKKYTELNSVIEKIPEAKFNALKLKHYRKLELSKLINKHPGSILLILKIKLFLASFKDEKK